MAKIIVLAGDFPQGDAEYLRGTITLKTPHKPRTGKSFFVSEFKDLTVENTDSNKNMKSAIGLGVVGAMFLGPVGAVAGYLLAGHNTEVTFLATLKNGQTLLAATDNETYQDISARFNRKTLPNRRDKTEP
ncbi:hypothetical protein PUP68_18685 [Pseudomonas chlororaphis]|uniref:hypothetical protein n=1 Tax=Pseudomonas chlororaphis TaxID=587753 RepID=UPI0006A62534|nr:hypothetical protein [Pseudomonas chlororaphis]MBP5076157.1 hypothetical protein [Pseudomonas chlororaphis]QTT88600.1 hypothetical protein HUT28_14905 [Pseudomonas chlororaphis]WDG77869.1 hypothetical protein PUP77_26175 [Pseudomonas chlororaphis]WDG82894.1 hypothetical protein PUP68_18685 [Pseudomonas chlororaphis]WDG89298.1 hypothetical protein PUP49_18500 [Pseudomonas chlororaphis]